VEFLGGLGVPALLKEILSFSIFGKIGINEKKL
jgi:hypothetical protein